MGLVDVIERVAIQFPEDPKVAALVQDFTKMFDASLDKVCVLHELHKIRLWFIGQC